MIKKLNLFALCLLVTAGPAIAMNNNNRDARKVILSFLGRRHADPLYIVGHIRGTLPLLVNELEVAQQELAKNPYALHVACRYNNLAKAKLFIAANSSSLNVKDANGDTPLHLAASSNGAEIVEVLIRNGAEINVYDAQGWTPLHNAVFWDYEKVVEVLAKHGDSLDAGDAQGRTPLHRAVHRNYENIAAILVKRGASIDVCDNDGETPLHYAASCNDAAIAKMLIRNGASIDVCDNDGETPLHYAASCNDAAIAKMLIRNGASIDVCDSKGDTLFHNAAFGGNKNIIELLIHNAFCKPSPAPSLNNGMHALRDISLNVLLRHLDDFDEGSLKEYIAPYFADVDRDPTRSTMLHALVNHVPLIVQQEVMKIWKHQADDESKAKMKLVVDAHLERHVKYLQRVLVIKNNLKITARRVAQLANKTEIMALLGSFEEASAFKDLDPKLQANIKQNIERKLTST